ncbi:hypothetical protein ANN_10809 [Periplaneta americana]|uniref:Uncharacterized protein n=1 Tax=Periplaneta americana TaxID=6978 RepID=A0ABQ8T4Z9_PERAM|nr:hypothetical protein ANN_10809 [Periplaneta americana]
MIFSLMWALKLSWPSIQWMQVYFVQEWTRVVQQWIGENYIEGDEVGQVECYPTPSGSQALGALATIRSYIQGQSYVNGNLFSAVNAFEN